jgi:hypothetical protein
MRLRLFALCVLSLSAFMGAPAAGPSSAAVCSGDLCVISTPFDGLRADIGANAPTRLVRLFTAEANFSQALHPPGPCTPGSCVASQVILIALDLQVRGLPTQGCPGGCTFTATNAYVLDHDVRGILSDAAIYALGLQLYPPGPPAIPPGPPGIPGSS